MSHGEYVDGTDQWTASIVNRYVQQHGRRRAYKTANLALVFVFVLLLRLILLS